jgi:hypothetical protein
MRASCAVKSESEFEPVEVSEEAFEEARYGRVGWCPSCEDFTTQGVSPKASGVSCVSCLDDGVSGTRHAVNAGFIQVVS